MSRAMRVLFFGSYDVHQHPRVQVLQEGLAARGHEILECNAPLGFDTAARVRVVKQPWRAPELGVRLTRAWARLWRMSRAMPYADAVLVAYMGHFDVHLARRLWPDRLILLDHFISARDTALDRGATSKGLLGVLGRLDRAAVDAADIPFVDAEGHLDLLEPEKRGQAVVVPIGAPSAWYHRPDRAAESTLRVVYHGTYTPLQGAPVIGDAIGWLAGDPRIVFTMVGDGQDRGRTHELAARNQHVVWHSWVEQSRMPALVAGHDVCLGIFGTTPKGLRVVPNKAYQGAAAGCAVLTSDTEPQRRALGEAAVYVPPGDATALAEALRLLADDRERVRELREAAYRHADEFFRPSAVVAALHARLVARSA
jgi:glycosyltransferase involved in cell wall biosynthesis